MTMTFRVVFDWTGDGILMYASDVKNKMQEALVSMYNAYANETNAHMNEWNKEAESLGLEGSEDWDAPYNKFMRDKFQMALDALIKNESFNLFQMNDNTCMFSAYVGEELELHLKLESKTLSSWIDVSFHLKAA